MTRKKIIITTLILVLITLSYGAWYIFNKPHRSLEDAQTVTVSADTLLAAYLRDEKLANIIYLDKALAVNGEIAELTTNQSGQSVIILKTQDPMSGVVCTLQETPLTVLQTGEKVRIKGFCSGFITDVVLRDCQIIKEN